MEKITINNFVTQSDRNGNETKNTTFVNGSRKYPGYRRVTFYIPNELYDELDLIRFQEKTTWLQIALMMAKLFVKHYKSQKLWREL